MVLLPVFAACETSAPGCWEHKPVYFPLHTAVKIQEDEEFIDKIYKERLPQLIKSNNTKCALAEALLLRYLERIGDHAVFMSDAINYIVTGKHKPSEKRIASHTKSS